jgi:hypothetical protein
VFIFRLLSFLKEMKHRLTKSICFLHFRLSQISVIHYSSARHRSNNVGTSETCVLSTQTESSKSTPSDWKQRFSASHSLLSESELAKSDESSVLSTSFLSSSLRKLPLIETYQAKQITQGYIFPRPNNKAGNCILRLNSIAHR